MMVQTGLCSKVFDRCHKLRTLVSGTKVHDMYTYLKDHVAILSCSVFSYILSLSLSSMAAVDVLHVSNS